MSAIIILVTAIAASGVLMMRFRKRWLAKINIAFTNRITSLFAGWLPGFGILTISPLKSPEKRYLLRPTHRRGGQFIRSHLWRLDRLHFQDARVSLQRRHLHLV